MHCIDGVYSFRDRLAECVARYSICAKAEAVVDLIIDAEGLPEIRDDRAAAIGVKESVGYDNQPSCRPNLCVIKGVACLRRYLPRPAHH